MPANASITIKGLDLILRAVQAFPTVLGEEIGKSIAEALTRIGFRLAQYPPERAGQRYQRTGDLGRGWTDVKPMITIRGAGVEGTLENKTSYADLVQGDRQAWMHVGRWVTAQAALDDAERDIEGALAGAVNMALQRVGLRGL